MKIEKEVLQNYSSMKFQKFHDLVESDKSLNELQNDANKIIQKINKKIKAIADSVYPGISEFRYVHRYIGNVSEINRIIPHDLAVEFMHAIENNLIEKLVDEALLNTKILNNE